MVMMMTTMMMMMMMVALEIIRKWLDAGCIVDAAACSLSREPTGTIKQGEQASNKSWKRQCKHKYNANTNTKMTGGTLEIRSDKSLTLLIFYI